MRRRTFVAAVAAASALPARAGSTLRAPRTVAQRVLGLLAVARASSRQREVIDWLGEHKLGSVLSAAERSFVESQTPSEADRIRFSWRIEAATPLLWALQKIESMPPRTDFLLQNHRPLVQELWDRPNTLLMQPSMRHEPEVLRAQFAEMNAHWRIRDAQFRNLPTPSDLDADVVVERHYALNWLIGYQNQDWDDVSTDT